jgi:glucosamine-6-phosphate deaminase
VLVACGASKAAPVAAAVEGPLAASCPASVLQWHPHVTAVVDESAASALTNSAYYRETHVNKPSWQHY